MLLGLFVSRCSLASPSVIGLLLVRFILIVLFDVVFLVSAFVRNDRDPLKLSVGEISEYILAFGGVPHFPNNGGTYRIFS